MSISLYHSISICTSSSSLLPHFCASTFCFATLCRNETRPNANSNNCSPVAMAQVFQKDHFAFLGLNSVNSMTLNWIGKFRGSKRLWVRRFERDIEGLIISDNERERDPKLGSMRSGCPLTHGQGFCPLCQKALGPQPV